MNPWRPSDGTGNTQYVYDGHTQVPQNYNSNNIYQWQRTGITSSHEQMSDYQKAMVAYDPDPTPRFSESRPLSQDFQFPDNYPLHSLRPFLPVCQLSNLDENIENGTEPLYPKEETAWSTCPKDIDETLLAAQQFSSDITIEYLQKLLDPNAAMSPALEPQMTTVASDISSGVYDTVDQYHLQGPQTPHIKVAMSQQWAQQRQFLSGSEQYNATEFLYTRVDPAAHSLDTLVASSQLQVANPRLRSTFGGNHLGLPRTQTWMAKWDPLPRYLEVYDTGKLYPGYAKGSTIFFHTLASPRGCKYTGLK
jgi:hypothetical protein